MAQTNLRDLLRARLTDLVLRKVSGWKVLVVDDWSARILSSCLKMTDLTNLEVSVVERVTLKRKPQPELDAVYFLSPREESIQGMISDFERGQRTYAKGHAFFTSPISDDVLKRFIDNPSLRYIMCMSEINAEFLVLEARAFLTSFMPKTYKGLSPFYSLFSPLSGDGLEKEIEVVATQLATLCVSLGDFPIIRFDDKGIPARTSGTITSMLAKAVQAKLDTALEDDPDAFTTTDAGRTILLILDRSVDLSSPSLHEFTYQAMVQDVVPLEDSVKYTYHTENMAGQQVDKAVVLDEEDELWARLRHRHIAETMETLKDEKEKLLSNSVAEKLKQQKGGGDSKSVKAIAAIARAMPEQAARVTKISAHVSLCQDAMAVFNSRRLNDLAEVEQDMVMGETAEGDAPENIEGRVKALLADPTITPDDKLRLVLLYRNYKGPLGSDDRAAIGVERSGLNNADLQAVTNMDLLGANKDSLLDSHVALNRRKKKGAVVEEVPYATSRYQPLLAKILEKAVAGSLSPEDFPYVKTPDKDEDDSAQKKGVSARTAKSKWAKGAGSSSQGASSSRAGSTGRIIVFIAGGMTYAEMRVAYEFEARSVFLGSTNVWRPTEFVKEMRTLKKPPTE